jgi:hypothetical protein
LQQFIFWLFHGIILSSDHLSHRNSRGVQLGPDSLQEIAGGSVGHDRKQK